MFSERALASQTVDIVLHGTDSSGVAITGATDFIYSVYRQSDAAQLDFSDSTFGGTITTGTQALTEIGSTAIYSHRLDLSAITNHATAKDTFYIVFAETGTDLLTIPRGEIVVNPDDMIAAAYDHAINMATATGGGAAGALLGINGTRANPSSVIANAATLAPLVGPKHLRLLDDISIIPTAVSWDGYFFEGVNAFASVNVGTGTGWDGASFRRVVVVGVFVAGGDVVFFEDTTLTVVTLPASAAAYKCALSGVITYTAGTLIMRDCFETEAAASAAFTLDINGEAVSPTIEITRHSGAITIANHSTSGTINVNMNGGVLTINATCTAGTINISGTGTYDNNGTSTVNATNLTDPRIAVALGLGNYTLDNIVYDSNGFMGTARIRIFDSSANTPSSGGGSETTGLLKTVTVGTSTADSTYPTQPGFVRGTV